MRSLSHVQTRSILLQRVGQKEKLQRTVDTDTQQFGPYFLWWCHKIRMHGIGIKQEADSFQVPPDWPKAYSVPS